MRVPYDLYVVTDEGLSNGLTHREIAELSCKGGADVIQLRDKSMDELAFSKCAREIRLVTERFGAIFIVNDRLPIALSSGADGAHLGQSDMPISEAKKIVPEGFILGCSVGSVEEALKAEADGADYVALSPVFNTSSKNDADPGHGLAVLSAIRKAVKIPVLAIGGINKSNAESVVMAGADGLAVISAVVSQKSVSMAAKEMKEIVRASKARR